MPDSARTKPWRNTSERTDPRAAPSAIRTPISCDRRVTSNDITP